MCKRIRKNQKENYNNEGMKIPKNVSSNMKKEKTSPIKSNHLLRKKNVKKI